MNKLKFRAWDKEDNKMIYWKDLSFVKSKINEDLRVLDLTYFPPRIKNAEIMQSTCLKDILGNDIYEGDIVKVLVKDVEPKIIEDKIYTGIITHEQGVFDVKTFNDTRLGIIPQMYMSDVDCVFRVLGNIYENKELLERDNNEEI